MNDTPFFGTARVIPVVSDVDHQRLVGVAYASDRGDLVITIKSEKFVKEVGAMFEITDAVQFMLGCQYVPAEKYQKMDSVDMRVRKLLIDFSNNPRVLVNSPGNPNDGRKGRVREINRVDASLWVVFESGPGMVSAPFGAHELAMIRDDVDIRVVER